MFTFLLKRLALTIPTFIALMFITFMMIRLVPGDPIEVRRGERGIDPERLAELRHEMGLDQPIWKQFSIMFLAFCTAISASRWSPRRRSLKSF